ncbi:hypothetical protein [Streptomyces sp. JW3]|uniref:restriction system modified-DNA reader domain-containing protein n=1 Tax=Streptomyces sp. JW3 TaxID=3456955 RepID=UPI003FA49ADE
MEEVVAAHRIEVDDDVYACLEREAKPLLDTPNSVLRRLLGLDPPSPNLATKRSRRSPLIQPISTGRLAVGQVLTWRRRKLGIVHEAVVTEDGKLRLEDGTVHDTPSGACAALAGHPVNGWTAWCTTDGNTLLSLREPI